VTQKTEARTYEEIRMQTHKKRLTEPTWISISREVRDLEWPEGHSHSLEGRVKIVFLPQQSPSVQSPRQRMVARTKDHHCSSWVARIDWFELEEKFAWIRI
jgi:hypothetical protein